MQILLKGGYKMDHRELIVLILAVILIACAAVIFEIFRELRVFCVRRYEVDSVKIPCADNDIRILFLSDLHNWSYGENNRKLLSAVRGECPDLILIGGDMLVAKPGESFDTALDFVKQLTGVAPVIYADGNHEQRMKEKTEDYGDMFPRYQKALLECGVRFLENESELVNLRGADLRICGLELPGKTYSRLKKADITGKEIAELTGLDPTADDSKEYVILLAHNPAYMEAYLSWGADLILSGHLHGGLIRVPGIGGIVTPQGFFFPKYSGEMTKEGEQYVIVSRGLGTHTLNIRLFNTPELISVRLHSEKD